MKLLFDFFPIVLFFAAYKLYDVFVATAVAIVASLAQVGYSLVTKRSVEPMHWISMVLIVVFGGATLILKDEQFIKWKPTVLNWLFALVFLGTQWIGRKPLIARLLDEKIQLPMQIWRRLNLSWAIFFLTVGAINLYVVYQFDTETWVNFKLFGMLGLTLVFVVAQSLFLSRYVQETATED